MESGNGIDFRRDVNLVRFRIRPDSHSTDRQWLFFAVTSDAAAEVTFCLEDSAALNVPNFWCAARLVVSHDDGSTWSRLALGHQDLYKGEYRFTVPLTAGRTLVSYHYPYHFSTLEAKLAEWRKAPGVVVSELGRSLQGRPLHLLTIGEGRIGGWITARQHAAETTCSFTVEGLIEFLLSGDPRAEALRRAVRFNIVPFVNPDGAVIGNYRDNAAGLNLNREWRDPSADAPEVAAVLRGIDADVAAGRPFNFFIDFHSDSSAREHYAFHAGPSANPPGYAGNYYRDIVTLLNTVAANAPEFLPGKGMTAESEGGISYHYIRQKYGVLAMIPEGGYSDVTFGANRGRYLEPNDHRRVGRAFGIALHDFYLGSK